jgi:hypothetical protein
MVRRFDMPAPPVPPVPAPLPPLPPLIVPVLVSVAATEYRDVGKTFDLASVRALPALFRPLMTPLLPKSKRFY